MRLYLSGPHRKLKYLELSYLLSVEDKDLCVKRLEFGLPNCEIVWDNRPVKMLPDQVVS